MSIPTPVPETPASGFNRVASMVVNYFTSRLQWLQDSLNPDRRRSLEDECGHRKGLPTAHEYMLLYQRDPIAARVVEIFPKECWQVQPRIYEEETPDVTTPFEEDVQVLGKQLQSEGGEPGYFQDERGSPLWELLKRADELCGIGRYGVIFLGLDDVTEQDQLEQAVNIKRKNKLLYATALSEVNCKILSFERDMGSPRFGLPVLYQLTFLNPDSRDDTGALGQSQVYGTGITLSVHWSRVVHIIDNPMESKIFGIPRMQPVVDRIDDLRKLYGSSAEMYYKGAFPGLAFEGHPGMGPGDIDLKGLKGMGEDYQNGLQRILGVLNMTVKSLAPQVKDPTPQIERQIEAICIKGPYPKRIFMGSERGDLSSTQDQAKWNGVLRGRHQDHCTPRVIVPFFTRLINLNILRRPSKGFSVAWPALTDQTPEEKAKVTFQRTQALAQFVLGNGRSLMTDLDYLVVIMELEESEAMAIIANRIAQPMTPAEQAAATGPMNATLPAPKPPIPPSGFEGGASA